MSFVSPAYLVLLVLVPALIALYFKKSRPLRRVVPNTRLWDQVLRRMSNNSLFHRYRHSLFLALQLAVVLSLVFGLARPHLKRALSGRTILVLDTSASMRATDVAPSRFEHAKRAALDLLSSVDSAADVALVTADSQVVVRAPFGSDPAGTLAALQAVECTDHPGPDLAELLAVVETLQRQRADRVEVFTDQLPADELATRLRGVSLTVHALGAGGDNAALTRFDLRASGKTAPGAPATCDAVVQVTSFAAQPLRGDVSLSQGGKPVASKPFDLKQKGDATVRFEGVALHDGVVEARLAVTSGVNLLEADDRAWAAVGKQAANVLLLGREHGALARVLKTIPGLSVTVIGWQQAGSMAALPSADITVAEDVYHPDLINRSALIFSGPGEPGSPAAPWLDGRTLDDPQPARFESTHPVLKYLSFKDVSFTRAVTLRRDPGDVEVLGAQGGFPLIVARTRGPVRHVICAFTTDGTDFSLRVGFPIFVMNALRWLAGSRMEGSASLKLGEPCPLPAGMPTSTVLEGPDGKPITWQSKEPTRTIPAACFPRAGVYTLVDGPRRVVIPATLSSFAESSVAPAQDKDLVRAAPGAATEGTAPAGIARWLIALALAVMATEWALYARMGG